MCALTGSLHRNVPSSSFAGFIYKRIYVCADGKGLCLLQFDSEPLMKSFLHFDLKMLVTQHLSAQMFHILAVCLIFCMHYSIILSHFAAYLWFLECEEWESHDAPSTYSPLTVVSVHYMLLLDSLCSHFFFSIFPQPPTGGCLLLDTVGVLPVKTRGNLVLVPQIFYGLYLAKCLEVAAKEHQINKT